LLDGDLFIFQRTRQHRAAERIAQRFRTDGANQRMIGKLFGLTHIHQAKAPGVCKHDHGAVIQIELHVVVLAHRGDRIAGRINAHLPRHAEMPNQRIMFSLYNKVLRTPSRFDDARAFKTRREVLGKRFAQIGAAQIDARKNSPLHHRGQSTANGFDFG